ncbi:relaxase/mobilization nuclease domain-containing protein [Bacteroidota bacterium]
MIHKFKTRKNIYSAKQLVNYILTDKGNIEHPFEAPLVLQNINRLDLKTLHLDFLDNYKYQPKRKGSTAFYHEILAISKSDADVITKPMLQDMMYKYIELRGLQNAIVLAKSHDNQHIHFMISGNELFSKKRLRMSQTEMKTLLIDFEEYHLEKYPEIIHSTVHTNKEKGIIRNIQQENSNHRKEKEYQLKLRLPNKKTQKETVAEMVQEVMKNIHNFSQLAKKIQAIDSLKIYTYRSKIKGVLYQNRKYRFSTLKISKDKILQLEQIQSRLDKLSLIQEMHKTQNNQDISLER